jgi:hypothetical protein
MVPGRGGGRGRYGEDACGCGPGAINGLGPTKGDNVVLRWDEELLQAIRANPGGTGPTVTARALGVAHTSTFDAWAAYDARAVGTRYGGSLRQPPQERTLENKNKAISFAAYTTLVDLFPSRAGDVALQMKELGYAVDGSDTSTPAKIGATTAKAVIELRHKDGANQLGGYADTTGYQPVNTPDQVNDRWRWQPLRVPLGGPFGKVQKPLTPQWATVVPFGMTSQFGHDVAGPPKLPNGDWSSVDIETAVKDTSYLDDDVKLFFALGNALMDASIAALQRRRGQGAVHVHRLGPLRASVTVKAGGSRFEPRTPTQPGTPATDVTLSWSTFSVAAGEAGMSRRYGGIHFESGDLHGRALGRDIGWDAWFKAQSYIKPISTGPL